MGTILPKHANGHPQSGHLDLAFLCFLVCAGIYFTLCTKVGFLLIHIQEFTDKVRSYFADYIPRLSFSKDHHSDFCNGLQGPAWRLSLQSLNSIRWSRIAIISRRIFLEKEEQHHMTKFVLFVVLFY